MREKIFFLMNVLLVASLSLAACAAPTKVPIEPTSTATPTKLAAATEAGMAPAYKDQ
jgi:hypothetical protein